MTHSLYEAYHEEGFAKHDGIFSEAEIQKIQAALARISSREFPGHIRENHKKTYRAFHGCHLYDKTFAELVKHPILIKTAQELLADDVYVHQLKINTKRPLHGESWPWHQDYIFWRNHDDLTSDQVTNIMIHLDPVTLDNGPLSFIPKSHQWGCLDKHTKINSSSNWEGNVSSNLTYQIEEKFVETLKKKFGIVHTTGPSGSAWWFSGNTCHASSGNTSKLERNVVIITYNSVKNAPKAGGDNFGKRPEFLCARDFNPLKPEGSLV